MGAPKKTNACRVLDGLQIVYDLRSYEVDEEDLSTANVAKKVGLPVSQLFETLCLRADDQSVVLAVIGGDRELDLKALARAARKKAVEPVAVRELQGLTGYVRGGCTALACKKPYPVFVGEEMLGHERVSVSAGQRGLQLWLAPRDYVRATAATVAPISRQGVT
jgi:Cys-tRNA(Pro)/Cys-tRNA(Cys) deacylase